MFEFWILNSSITINMELELEEQLALFLDHFACCREMQELKQLKEEILKDDVLVAKIQSFQRLSKYAPDYLEKKREILHDPVYQRYLTLERELTFFTMRLSKELKSLVKEEKLCE